MTQVAEATATGAVVLRVSLDLSGNPQVTIDARDKHADSGVTITWMRESGRQKFKFVSFGPRGEEFRDLEIKDHKITCKFETSKPSNTKHHYTIFVESAKGMHHSDEMKPGGPDEGRAVIRN